MLQGQVGANLPADFSNVRLSAGGVSGAANDFELQTSVVYGGKAGYYFDSVKWLGSETEVFNATPHVKQQDLVIGGVNVGTLPGIYNRTHTWAPVNLVVRYQAGAFEPYLDGGSAYSFPTCRLLAFPVRAPMSD